MRGYVIGGSLYSTRGSQADIAQLRRVADTLSLNGNVGFTGFVDDPAAAIRALDIVVHASTSPEPFGRVIAESMACGKAVIVTAAGGALEIVTSGQDAIAIAPGDAFALADSIRQLAMRRTAKSATRRGRAQDRGESFRSRPHGARADPDLRRARCGRATEPMRVLHINAGNMFGGVETILTTLARDRALTPDVEPEFALCFAGRLSDELAAAGVPVHMLGDVRIRYPLTLMRARRRLREILSSGTYDVAVCHMAWTQALFGSVARASRVPVAMWQHMASNGRHWLEQWARYSGPDLVICTSHFAAREFRGVFSMVPVEVVHCPVARHRLATRSPIATRCDPN